MCNKDKKANLKKIFFIERKKVVTGFTLIELMIVVAIIDILATIAMPKFVDLIRKTKESTTKGNLAVLRNVLAVY
ncbi:prepilin-type N-terminal cleavage/methylation domain-containing protein [bacterium]|nr:prepilin-type N-terminal cleavage/methylation domain-containing protein [bacterium]